MTPCNIRRFFVPDPDHSMYVERWCNSDTPKGNLIFIHGGSHTGVCWTDPPGDTVGWVPYFVQRGWCCYVVDWPGVGRSGFGLGFSTMGSRPVQAALVRLLESVGPSVLVGHSIGGTLSLKVAETVPDSVLAIVGVNPGEPGNIAFDFPIFDESTPSITSAEIARQIFTSSARFPIEHFDEYYASLVPMSPALFNEVGARQGDGLMLNDTDLISQRPILTITAEQDHLVLPEHVKELAELVKAQFILAGRDWGLEGFGHLIPIERGSEEIASRIADWLATSVSLAAEPELV